MDTAQPTRGSSSAIPVEELRSTLDDFGDMAASFIRERPIVTLLIAAGIGWLVGRLVR